MDEKQPRIGQIVGFCLGESEPGVPVIRPAIITGLPRWEPGRPRPLNLNVFFDGDNDIEFLMDLPARGSAWQPGVPFCDEPQVATWNWLPDAG